MKKSIILAAALGLTAVSMSARLNGDGYYRIQNYASGRYVTIIDDKGWLNYSSSTAELKAIELWTDEEGSVMSDPATVMHIVPAGSDYDLQAQGTGVYKIIQTYVKVREDSRYKDTYWAYGSKNGVTMYLSDIQDDPTASKGVIETIKYDSPMRNWYIKPIVATDDESFFGIKPTCQAGSSYYAPFYAGFPFNEASTGIEICYVTKVDKEHGIAVYSTVPAGTGVAASVPVFVKVGTANATTNRINIGKGTDTCKGNILKGTYFDSTKKNHENNVPYDAATMRTLGVTKDGKIGFVTASIKLVPRNTSYLVVDKDCPAELTLMTQAEYDNYLATLAVLPTAVSLDKKEATLTIGQSVKLTATVAPANADDKSVKWTTSNSAVATVDAEGNVTAVAVGTADITATTCNGLTATCKVTVNPVEAASVTLDMDDVALQIGSSIKITATVAPANTTDPTVTWATSDAKIASVDAEGNVTAVGLGTAVITATCGKASATCKVEVLPVEAEKVVLNETSAALLVGEEADLVATVHPDNTTDKRLAWTSDNAEVATVDNLGHVIAVGEGVATITAACGEATATCTVTVSRKEQTIVWDQVIETLTEGDEVELVATASSGLEVTFTVEGEGAVIEGGKLLLIEAGVVTVTATQEGNNEYKAAEPVVRVFNVESGINDVVMGNIAVNVADGNIVISGKDADTAVRVYTVGGKLVYSGTAARVPVARASAYIVIVGSRIAKISVK